MATLAVTLNEKNSGIAEDLARRTGKTPEQIVNEVFEHYGSPDPTPDEAERARQWQEALLGIRGMWKDRDDLPDYRALRESWDRRITDVAE